MSKLLWLGASLALVLVCSGCFTMPGDSSVKAPPATVRALTPPPPPITPEMVTPENAQKMADALGEEIRRDAQMPLLTTP